MSASALIYKSFKENMLETLTRTYGAFTPSNNSYYNTRDERIRELAYYKWLDDGCPEGNDIHYWLEAESEYRAAERLVMGV